MAAGAQAVTRAWKEWGLQALVLLSFTLQVALLILAEFRRRIDSGVLRAFVWSAYMLADATAIYVLGHMSVTGRSPEHDLMALWAALLLLHLGGQDNITAYAIEDNQLWLRHLQTLAVQVAAAAYVLYESLSAGGQPLLLPATIVMFAVGVVKYGERVWALKCAGSSPSGSNYRSFDRSTAFAAGPSASHRDTEAFLLIAHLLLDAAMDLLKGPSTFVDVHYGTSAMHGEELYKVVEMQLSLMHDVFYTKAPVVHSWYGACIHAFSTLGAVAALFLFHLLVLQGGGHRQEDVYSGADVAITYVLLAGAVVLEITSAMRAMLSSWTCALLDQRAEEGKTWHLIAYAVASLRRLVHAADWRRYWSGSMGQHNLLQLCARSWASRSSKVARWMGVEDPWNSMAYSSSIPVPACIRQLVAKRVLEREGVAESSPDHIHNSRGRAALKSKGLHESLAWSVDDIELDEGILVWHVATDLYLRWFEVRAMAASGRQDDDDAQLPDLAVAIEALSNYMLFLLAARTYMLPPPASRNAYVHACYFLTYLKRRTPEDLTNLLRCHGNKLNTRSRTEVTSATTSSEIAGDSSRYNKTLGMGAQLGAKLIDHGLEADSRAADMLKLITQVWVEMLCYAGYRCSAYSHAKQLGNGGELITIAALLIEHVRRRTSMP